MNVKELIEKLQGFPQDADIIVCDWRMNLYNAHGEEEGVHEGLMPVKEVEYYTKDVNKPFVGITYLNDDYTEKGEVNIGASMPNNLWQEAVS